MPEMSGRELAERLHARIPALRALFMSGYADEAVTRNGVLEAGTAYLEKPFSAADLAAKVRETLDRPARRSIRGRSRELVRPRPCRGRGERH